jgi:hypothetical protein
MTIFKIFVRVLQQCYHSQDQYPNINVFSYLLSDLNFPDRNALT